MRTINIIGTTTGNLHNCLVTNPGAFYVGRGRGSVLGNPFEMRENTYEERAFVVSCYQVYMAKIIKEGYEPFQAASYCEMQFNVTISPAWSKKVPTRAEVLAVLEMYRVVYELSETMSLVCFCCTKQWQWSEFYDECHAEVIASVVTWLSKNNLNAKEL